MSATVYLIPSLLDENAVNSISNQILSTAEKCDVLFVENERTTRRFLKKLSKTFDIDSRRWIVIDKEKPNDAAAAFHQYIKTADNIGIISEAGCPGIADPGQALVAIAHQHGAKVIPLVGPSSILLALMASGLNGQRFKFNGYLPIDNVERQKKIKQLEQESAQQDCTEIFIETPYRNNQLIEAVLNTCQPTTQLCIAADLTGEKEFIKTQQILSWKKEKVDLHKRPAVFLLHA